MAFPDSIWQTGGAAQDAWAKPHECTVLWRRGEKREQAPSLDFLWLHPLRKCPRNKLCLLKEASQNELSSPSHTQGFTWWTDEPWRVFWDLVSLWRLASGSSPAPSREQRWWRGDHLLVSFLPSTAVFLQCLDPFPIIPLPPLLLAPRASSFCLFPFSVPGSLSILLTGTCKDFFLLMKTSCLVLLSQ